jgi:RsiW-degrading membrane proteinase PrsW (M82 family)
MLESIQSQFQSFYRIPGLTFKMILIAIALALVFAAIWLIIYRPWRFNKAWWVVIFLLSAILTWIAIAFVQVPLQIWTQDFMVGRMGEASFMDWLLLTGIPMMLISGLVQEGAKLIPVIAMWLTREKQLDPLTGLWAGAVSGAGFGVFEAVWAHNTVLASGWTWQLVSQYHVTALLPFIERFFAIGFHIAVSALAGYGWAKGMKWQYYLIAAGLHGLFNYAAVLANRGILTENQIELYIAVIAVAVTIYAFFIMRRSTQPPIEPVDAEIPPAPETPDDF